MLEDLNPQQQKAVLAIDGPVMVFAGAGSGKTRTLTHRVAYMIQTGEVAPGNILAITFTNRATNEMRERLLKMIGPYAYEATISTFHSLCARILRKEIGLLGYKNSFSIADEEDQLKKINEAVATENLDKKHFPGKRLQKTFNYCKCFGLKPQDPMEQRIFSRYEKIMKDENLLDFEDLLLKVKELFTLFPEVKEKYAQKYRYILVDEFQDTNLIQYQIVRMLAEKNRNFFVVGDDDQSIYSFRGTNYENMQLFKKDFPEHKLFLLTQNYRSTQAILDGCNRLIANNKNREQKELFSDIPGSPEDVKIFQAYNEKFEVDYILNEVFSLKLKGAEYSQVAVLYRNSVLMRNLEIGLIQMGLPYQVYGGVSYLRRREIKDIIAYFKLILDHDDVASFKRIINVPSRLIGDQTVQKVLEIKEKYRLDLFSAIDSCKTLLTPKRYQSLQDFKNQIISFREKLDSENLIDLYDSLLEEIKYRDFVNELDNPEERLENLEEFKSILVQIETDGRDIPKREKLQEAFDEAVLSEDKPESLRQDPKGITLSTIHSAKGLEFDYVFVIGLEENVFPNAYRFASEEELEEERRIAYVAFTRAKKKLYLLSAQSRLLYGEVFHNPTSRFVLEFTGTKSLEIEEDFNQDPEYEKPSQADPVNENTKANYRVGDKVVHQAFGSGIIIAIEGECGQIFFDREKSLKKILLDHPALRKM